MAPTAEAGSSEVVVDSGDPGLQGFSYDWWGPIRAYTRLVARAHRRDTSAIWWDRWALRNLYSPAAMAASSSTHRPRRAFSVLVEDCVSIEARFGGGVAELPVSPRPSPTGAVTSGPLDFWGHGRGIRVRVENPTMPEHTVAVFEDCVMVGPQCALKGSNFGYETYSRVRCVRCRLAALNFSQPQGTPTDGIIQSVQRGELLHVDLEDCLLMGYRLRGHRR